MNVIYQFYLLLTPHRTPKIWKVFQFYYLILLQMKYRSQKTRDGASEPIFMNFKAFFLWKFGFLAKGGFSHFSTENSILRHNTVKFSPVCSNDYLFSTKIHFQNTFWIFCWMKIGSYRIDINRKSYTFLMCKNTLKIPNKFVTRYNKLITHAQCTPTWSID